MKDDALGANPVLAAIRNKRGFAATLGKRLGITRSAVWMWERVPPKHALTVAKFMKLHPHRVCPDIYPPPRKGDGRATLRKG
jgi:hypothetical protein